MKTGTKNRNAIRRTFVLRIVLSLQMFQNGKCCLFEFDDQFADKLMIGYLQLKLKEASTNKLEIPPS
jgi:hypothetical protein